MIQWNAPKLELVGCWAACLLAMTVAGCQFHRTGHGFILRSHWALELDTRPGAEPCDDACHAHADGMETGPYCCPGADPRLVGQNNTAISPDVGRSEFMPWRARLRNRRLMERLFHRLESPETTAEIQSPDFAAISRPEPRRPDLVDE